MHTPRTVLLLAVLLTVGGPTGAVPRDREVERASVSSLGAQGNLGSNVSAITPDGRYVAFVSDASNLVPGDTNGVLDVFVRDRQTGTTERVSVSSGGLESPSESGEPAISDDGRYVCFSTPAPLVPGDTNGAYDVHRYDRTTGLTIRISAVGTSASANGASFSPSISGDGRFVAFFSYADNLLATPTNGFAHVYVRDTLTNTTKICSVSSVRPGEIGDGDSRFPNLTPDGSKVVFDSSAENFTARSNGRYDVFLHDLATGQTIPVSRGYNGAIVNGPSYSPTVSSNGTRVAFESTATVLVQGGTAGRHIFVYDVPTDTTYLVSQSTSGFHGNLPSVLASISRDGTRVAFQSLANTLVSNDTNDTNDVFVRDLSSGVTVRASTSASGTQGDDESYYARLAGNGRFVSFASAATNLVPGDTNAWPDVFTWDALPPASVSFRSAGANPSSYVADSPVLGAPWTASVNLATTGHSHAIVHGTAAPANLMLAGGQVLLIGGPLLFRLGLRPGPVATWTVLVPNDPSLAGLVVHTQAAHLLGVAPFALSNARDLCFGY